MFITFLKIGITFASFHMSGYVEVTKMFWEIILRGRTTELSPKSSILPGIPSEPVALMEFKFWINEVISLQWMDIWSIFLLVSKLSGGSTLLLVIGVHCHWIVSVFHYKSK